MLSSAEKQKISCDRNFMALVNSAMILVAVPITFENPSSINFGGAHETIEATGRLGEAQILAHRSRHALAMQTIKNNRTIVGQAVNTLANTAVEELLRRGMSTEAGKVEDVLRKIATNSAVESNEWLMLEQTIIGIVSYGFTSMSGFNPYAFGVSNSE